MSEGVVTVRRASELLRCSSGTIRNLIRRGVLPAYRLGKVFRIAVADLERLRLPARRADLERALHEHAKAVGGLDVGERDVTPDDRAGS